MPKKRVKVQKFKSKAPSKREIESALLENFIKLQGVLANLSLKFDNLSDNISKLLQLFEIAAKSFVKKQEEGSGDDTDLLKKLDTLLDQNKTIAKGLTLMEEKIRHRLEGPQGLPSINPNRKEGEFYGIYPENLGKKPKPRTGTHHIF